MASILEKLLALYEKKTRAGIFEIRGMIDEQLQLISRVLQEEKFENEVMNGLLKEIKNLEMHKEFNISLEEYERIVKQRLMGDHAQVLFSQNIENIRKAAWELQNILEKQRQNVNDRKSYAREKELCSILADSSRNILTEDSLIRQYMVDMKGLSHDTRYFKGIRVVAKLIRKVMLRMTVSGLENIPLKGPCMITPHHVNAIFDPVVISAIMPRQVFMIVSIEPFVQNEITEKIDLKQGYLPYKREDSQYGALKPGVPKQEDLNKYQSSNSETMANFLNYMRYGNAVMIFPEGDTKVYGRYARPNNEEFIPLHSGFMDAVVEAKRLYKIDVPIIPVGINYTKGLYLNAFARVSVNIGKPIWVPSDKILASKPGTRKQMKDYYISMVDSEIRRLSTPMKPVEEPALA